MNEQLTKTKNFDHTESNNKVTVVGFLCVTILLLSFSYELPILNLTGKYRTNPKLFDFAAVLLFFYWFFAGRFRGWRIRLWGNIILPWVCLTCFFSIAAFVSMLWLPHSKGIYSFFYWLKYVEALIVLLIMSSIPYDRNILNKLVKILLIGGLWVSGYAILQYFGIVDIKRALPNDTEISMMTGTINSTLGVSYYHLGLYSIISFLLGLLVFTHADSGKWKFLGLVALIGSTVTIVISGSKTGLFGLGIVLCQLFVQQRIKSRFSIYVFAILSACVAVYLFQNSFVKDRIIKKSGGTPFHRIVHGFDTIKKVVDTSGYKVWFVGGGFYVAPIMEKFYSGGSNSNKLHYRIGYGNHNIFLFPLEQGGVGGFLCGIWLWIVIHRFLRVAKKKSEPMSFEFSLSSFVLIYFYVLLIAGMAGQFFYLGLGTEHFNVYQMVIFILATQIVYSYNQSSETTAK